MKTAGDQRGRVLVFVDVAVGEQDSEGGRGEGEIGGVDQRFALSLGFPGA